jgi:hypothetical protein
MTDETQRISPPTIYAVDMVENSGSGSVWGLSAVRDVVLVIPLEELLERVRPRGH